MKLLFTEGIGASQTTTNAQDEKIPVYETKTAAENDLANLEVGQIIATKDEGNELSNPVDVVQNGNMHAVTSNAVADYTKGVKVINLSGNTGNNGFFIIDSLSLDNVIIGGTVLNINDSYLLFGHYRDTIYAIPKYSGGDNKMPNTYVELIIAYV